MHEHTTRPLGFGLFPFRKRNDRPSRKANRRARRFVTEQLEERRLLAGDVQMWQNPLGPTDVNNDGYVAPLDALIIINDLNANGPRGVGDFSVAAQGDGEGASPTYLDVNGDGYVTPQDALIVLNELNAEGEPGEKWMKVVLAARDLDDSIILPGSSIPVGTPFTLQAYVQDIRNPDTWPPPEPGQPALAWGVFTAYLDVTYDADVAEVAWREVQEVSLPGLPAGGNFTLSFDGNTTADIPFDAGSDAVASALEALPGIGSGDVSVSETKVGGAPAWRIAFGGTLANTNVSELVGDGSGLTDLFGSPISNTDVVVEEISGVDSANTANYRAIKPIAYGEKYPNVHAGDLSAPGLIDEIGGVAAGEGTGVGFGLTELFSVPFLATAAGTLDFVTDERDISPEHDPLLYNWSEAVPTDRIEFGSYTLIIGSSTPYTAVADALSVNEDSAGNSLDVLANDTVVAGVTISGVGTTDNGGTATIAGDGLSLIYTPAPNFFGTETFTYSINDGQDVDSTATVTVTVTNVNDDPTPVDDSFPVTEDSQNNLLDVLDNDTDPDGDALTVSGIVSTQFGTASPANAGTRVAYTPPADFVGIDTVWYTVSDGNGGTAAAKITIDVGDSNDPPTAADDGAIVAEDSADNAINVLDNDSTLPDVGETLSITGTTDPANGSVTVVGTSVLYTPDANFNGPDSFDYTISDGNGGTDTATVSVTVTPVNDDPTAGNDAFTVEDNSTGNLLPVLDNDTLGPDVGETLTITGTGTPNQGGTVSTSGSNLAYTPATDFIGIETFTYTISDGNGGADTATVTVDVAPASLPRAKADQFTVIEDSSDNTLAVLSNDLASEGGTLQITGVDSVDNGTVTIEGGTTLRYTPDPDFAGTETFTYTLEDGIGDPATGTVVVTVSNVNDDPTAADDVATIAEDSVAAVIDVLGNDTAAPDVGETLTISQAGGTSNGSVNVAPGSTQLQYTPDADFFGNDTITYTIVDGNGGSAQASVAVTVTNVNDDPAAVADTATVAEDSAATTIDVLANDSAAPDVGETLTITAVSTGNRGGTATFGNGTALSYTPAPDFFGTETFTYTVSDGNGGTAQTSVDITVTPVNDDPIANNDEMLIIKDMGAVKIDVLDNDSIGPDTGETLRVTGFSVLPANGTVAIINDGAAVQYTPASGYLGSDSFRYVISDGNQGEAEATVSVNVVDYIPSDISGYVYFDVNNNGQIDGEQKIGGVTVTLAGTDQFSQEVEITAVTDANGYYEFPGLVPGSYTLTETQPMFTIDGIHSAGSAGGDTSVANVIAIDLEQDTVSVGNNFGELGRQAEFISLRDFFNSVPENSLIVAVSPTQGQLWYASGQGWEGYNTIYAGINAELTTLRIGLVDDALNAYITDSPAMENPSVEFLGSIGDVQLLRIDGRADDFEMTPVQLSGNLESTADYARALDAVLAGGGL